MIYLSQKYTVSIKTFFNDKGNIIPIQTRQYLYSGSKEVGVFPIGYSVDNVTIDSNQLRINFNNQGGHFFESKSYTLNQEFTQIDVVFNSITVYSIVDITLAVKKDLDYYRASFYKNGSLVRQNVGTGTDFRSTSSSQTDTFKLIVETMANQEPYGTWVKIFEKEIPTRDAINGKALEIREYYQNETVSPDPGGYKEIKVSFPNIDCLIVNDGSKNHYLTSSKNSFLFKTNSPSSLRFNISNPYTSVSKELSSMTKISDTEYRDNTNYVSSGTALPPVWKFTLYNINGQGINGALIKINESEFITSNGFISVFGFPSNSFTMSALVNGSNYPIGLKGCGSFWILNTSSSSGGYVGNVELNISFSVSVDFRLNNSSVEMPDKTKAIIKLGNNTIFDRVLSEGKTFSLKAKANEILTIETYENFSSNSWQLVKKESREVHTLSNGNILHSFSVNQYVSLKILECVEGISVSVENGGKNIFTKKILVNSKNFVIELPAFPGCVIKMSDGFTREVTSETIYIDTTARWASQGFINEVLNIKLLNNNDEPHDGAKIVLANAYANGTPVESTTNSEGLAVIDKTADANFGFKYPVSANVSIGGKFQTSITINSSDSEHKFDKSSGSPYPNPNPGPYTPYPGGGGSGGGGGNYGGWTSGSGFNATKETVIPSLGDSGFVNNVADYEHFKRDYYKKHFSYELICAYIYQKKKEKIGYDFYTQNRLRQMPKYENEFIMAVEDFILKRKVEAKDRAMFWNLYRMNILSYAVPGFDQILYIKDGNAVNSSGITCREKTEFERIYKEHAQVSLNEADLLRDLIYYKAQTVIHVLSSFGIDAKNYSYRPEGGGNGIDVTEKAALPNLMEDDDVYNENLVYEGNIISKHNLTKNIPMTLSNIEYIRKSLAGKNIDQIVEFICKDNYNDSVNISFLSGVKNIANGNYNEKAYHAAKLLLLCDHFNLSTDMTKRNLFPDTTNDGKSFFKKNANLFNKFVKEYVLLQSDSGWDKIRKMQYLIFNAVLPNPGIYYLRNSMLVDYRIANYLSDNFFNNIFPPDNQDRFDYYIDETTEMKIRHKSKGMREKFIESKKILDSQLKKVREDIVITTYDYQIMGYSKCYSILSETCEKLKKKNGYPFVFRKSSNDRQEAIRIGKTVKSGA